MKRTVALFALLLLPLSSAFAGEHKRLNMSLLGGTAMPSGGKWSSNKGDGRDLGYKNSFATSFAADYEVSDSLALGLEVGKEWKHRPENTGTLQSSDKCGNVDILRITPYARLFKKLGKVTIYEQLGVGLYEVDRSELAQSVWFLPITERYSTSKDYLGFNLGFGASYAITEHLDLGLDLRWHHIFSNTEVFDAGTSGTSFSQIKINNIVPSVKVQYGFDLL